MRTVKVLHNQTFLDIAMQYNGNAEYALPMAAFVGKSITADLQAGSTEVLKDYLLTAKESSIAYLLSKAIHLPASKDEALALQVGINFMQIENDFKVS